jgi:hypothetical protein
MPKKRKKYLEYVELCVDTLDCRTESLGTFAEMDVTDAAGCWPLLFGVFGDSSKTPASGE